jgi:HD superfamily phosphohydrolase
MDRDQRIRDPIHNLIGFSTKQSEDSVLWALIQTVPVQRLRRIKQLGFSEFVYPGATHSRFSHVLGAMHMARRMLDVFERNAVFVSSKKEHPRKRLATLAAALLHDIGHGPYSHVFEEVSADLKLEESHENYTMAILEADEIKRILLDHDIYEDTKKFFTTEAGYDPYTRIISSQMDCDRLDFLVRDRYHTGIRSAAIDLEWLFDSLRIEEVPIDPVRKLKGYSFVVLPKGISVVEEFVLSYMRMYQNIYFHKTTRAVQHMVTDIVQMAASGQMRSNSFIKDQPILRYFRDKRFRTIENYLRMDDSSIISLLRLIADNKLGPISELANRYFKRAPYKCLELPTSSSGEVRKTASAQFIDALGENKIQFFDDRLPIKSYKQYDVMDDTYLKNILIKKDGEYEPLGNVSEVVKNIPPKTIRIYFRTRDDRDRADRILAKCLGISRPRRPKMTATSSKSLKSGKRTRPPNHNFLDKIPIS